MHIANSVGAVHLSIMMLLLQTRRTERQGHVDMKGIEVLPPLLRPIVPYPPQIRTQVLHQSQSQRHYGIRKTSWIPSMTQILSETRVMIIIVILSQDEVGSM